jgi:hypothetical protein
MRLVLHNSWYTVTLQPIHNMLSYTNVVLVTHLTILDEVESSLGLVLKGIKVKASLENDEQHEIEDADIELKFSSQEATGSCVESIRSLQKHLFMSYLQSPRLGEEIQLQR